MKLEKYKYDAEKEKALLKEYGANRSNELREKIIELNYTYIEYVIWQKFPKFAQYHEDLFSVGYLGLCEAIDRFDISLIDAFGSYKFTWIRKKMQDFLKKESKYVSLIGQEDKKESRSNQDLLETLQPAEGNQENITDATFLIDKINDKSILNKKERDSILEYYINGKSQKEINAEYFNGRNVSWFHLKCGISKLKKYAKQS